MPRDLAACIRMPSLSERTAENIIDLTAIQKVGVGSKSIQLARGEEGWKRGWEGRGEVKGITVGRHCDCTKRTSSFNKSAVFVRKDGREHHRSNINAEGGCE